MHRSFPFSILATHENVVVVWGAQRGEQRGGAARAAGARGNGALRGHGGREGPPPTEDAAEAPGELARHQLRDHPLPRHLPHRPHHDRHRHSRRGRPGGTHQLRQEAQGVRGFGPGNTWVGKNGQRVFKKKPEEVFVLIPILKDGGFTCDPQSNV